ncbi:MAG: hypothetical protein ACXWUF_11720 [Methylomagnum sp.]
MDALKSDNGDSCSLSGVEGNITTGHFPPREEYSADRPSDGGEKGRAANPAPCAKPTN